jgi:hypothetical protein
MKQIYKISLFCLLYLHISIAVYSQLGSQELPIPVKSNQIVGIIKPRRVGDDRLTRIFYSLEAEKGDLFINIEAENLNGDLDLFIASNLKPLTKITIYAADTKIETGRVIYLRNPEKLLLRIEGRTLNDNPARFTIKFAGSFIAKESNENTPEENLEAENASKSEKSSETKSEVKNKDELSNPETEISENHSNKKTDKKNEQKKPENAAEKSYKDKLAKQNKDSAKKARINEEVAKVDEETNRSNDDEKPSEKLNETKLEKKDSRNLTKKNKQASENKTQSKESAPEEEKTKETEIIKEAKNAEKGGRINEKNKTNLKSAFADMTLVVIFKNGNKLEKPMKEIVSFTINEEDLVIVTKDGKKQIKKASDILQVIIK